ncbi:uncharacterized protein [Penaeus vannamei]|uniref:uncharacterized protein n=1 Tax=Penaeus vannamei TaxID=6689 RepID=UPI00387F7170
METAILPASPRLQFPPREKLSNSTILPFEIDSPPAYDTRERYVKFDFLANWSADHELPFRERIRQLFPGNWTGERQPGRRIFDSPMVNETALLPVTEPDGGRPSLPFQMSLHLEVIWSVAFIVLIVGACVGNVLVIMIILGNRRMKTTTNYFLLNLSGADLSMAIFNCTFNFFYMLKRYFGTHSSSDNYLAGWDGWDEDREVVRGSIWQRWQFWDEIYDDERNERKKDIRKYIHKQQYK